MELLAIIEWPSTAHWAGWSHGASFRRDAALSCDRRPEVKDLRRLRQARAWIRRREQELLTKEDEERARNLTEQTAAASRRMTRAPHVLTAADRMRRVDTCHRDTKMITGDDGAGCSTDGGLCWVMW